jgi:hypothetical protein
VEAPQQPSRVYLYAAEKWGKTSFAAHAPKPIFLMTSGETGLLDLINFGQIEPTAHFPEDFKNWPDLLDALDALVDEKHDYKTLVLDTANGAERLLADHVLRTEFRGEMGGKNGYGSYGKGDLACIPYWAEFLRRLDRVRSQRSMSIILLAHSRIKSVNNPEGDDYDQLRPEGIDKLWPLTHKWASVIGAGTYKVFVKDDKADGGRERVIRLRGTAAVVSGNRYGLPEVIPCGGNPAQAWGSFAKAIGDAKKAAAKKTAAKSAAPVPAPAPQQPERSAPAQEEGEQRSDFTREPATPAKATTAPTASAPPVASSPPSARAGTAPATVATEPGPRPMPEADR